MKTITADQAWALIAEMGWGTRTTDYKHLAETYYKLLGKDGMKQLEKFVCDRASDLYGAVQKHEAKFRSLEVGSDDGFSDLRFHVVGLGKNEFERCLEFPELLKTRHKKGEYTESFHYVFQEPDPPRTPEKKAETLAKLMEKIAEVDKQARALDAGLTLLRDKMRTLSILAETVKQDIESA